MMAASAIVSIVSCQKNGPENGEGQETPAPEIVWESNPDFETVNIDDNLDASLSIVAPGKIKNLVVGINSDLLEPILSAMQVPAEFDLVSNTEVGTILDGLTQGALPTGEDLLDKEEVERRVRRAMEVVGLPYEEFAERSPFELSGGEKRRAAIAGVIAMEPKILVLDEPVAGLDPVGRREILALVRKLHEEVSPTVIMVSHYMDDIAEMADRIVALKEGRIVADGSPAEVFGDREKLAAAGLSLPTAARIVDSLAARGIALPRTIVTARELADALVAYREAHPKPDAAENAAAKVPAEESGEELSKESEREGEERDV